MLDTGNDKAAGYYSWPFCKPRTADIITIFTSKVTVNGWKGMRKGHATRCRKEDNDRPGSHVANGVKVRSMIILTICQPTVGPGTGGREVGREK